MKLRYLILAITALFLVVACGKYESSDKQFTGSADSVTNPQLVNGVRDPRTSYLTVMTYNIYGIPCQERDLLTLVTSVFGIGECPDNSWYSQNLPQRLNFLGNQLASLQAQGSLPDILLLQEAFRADFSQINDRAMEAFLENAPYTYKAYGPSAILEDSFSSFIETLWEQDGIVDSGLVILSKYPISQTSNIEFGQYCAADICKANKGAQYARIELPNGHSIDIFNTHHQSFDQYEQIRVMHNQIFMDLVAQEFDSPWAVMAGDFNFKKSSGFISYADFIARSQSQHVGSQCISLESCRFSLEKFGEVSGMVYDHQFTLAKPGFLIEPEFVIYGDWLLSGRSFSDHNFMIVGYKLSGTLQGI